MNRALPLLMCALLSACQSGAPRTVPPPPPARVSTTALAAALGVTRHKTASAGERVQVVTQTVERLIPTADPVLAAELATVRDELFRVSADLRDAQAATAAAETERAHEQRRADEIHAWALDQQKEAAANGEGWRQEEAAHRADNAHHREIINARNGTIFKLTLALIGVVAVIAGFFFARQYLPFLKFL